MSKKAVLTIISSIVVLSLLAGLRYHLLSKNTDDEETTNPAKINITLEISADGKNESFAIETSCDTLGEAIVDSGYVKNDRAEYGLYIKTVFGIWKDGRTADESKQEWWCITKDGQSVATGADSIKIADGEHYELTLKTGY